MKPVSLNVLPAGIEQQSVGVRRNRLCLYLYKDIERVTLVTDVTGGVVITCAPSFSLAGALSSLLNTFVDGGFGRQHVFAVENRDDFLRKVQAASTTMVGVDLRVNVDPPTTRADVTLDTSRLGKFSDDDAITSLAEFK